jgi:hypothetical protein
MGSPLPPFHCHSHHPPAITPPRPPSARPLAGDALCGDNTRPLGLPAPRAYANTAKDTTMNAIDSHVTSRTHVTASAKFMNRPLS